MSTLNDFIASVKSEGLMRTNRFLVEFNMVGDTRLVQLYCDSVQLPGLTISTTQARTYGEPREIPYERLFDNINLTFHIDNSMNVKMIFDNWIQSIQNPKTRSMSYYDDYVTNMRIYVLDVSDSKRYYVDLFECYPKSIGSIQMDHSSKDSMKLQVSINYKYWKSGSMAESSSNGPVQDGLETLVSDQGYTNLDDPFAIETLFTV